MGDSAVLPTDRASTTDRIGLRDAQQQKEIKALTAGLQKISNQLGMTKPEGDGALWYPLHFFAIPVAFFFWKEAKTTKTDK